MQPGLSKPVSMQYKKERFESLLRDAEANASSDWDRSFVNDMTDRYKIFGSGMYLSTLQRYAGCSAGWRGGVGAQIRIRFGGLSTRGNDPWIYNAAQAAFFMEYTCLKQVS